MGITVLLPTAKVGDIDYLP